MVLEKMLENPLNGKEVNPANPKGNQACIFIGIGVLALLNYAKAFDCVDHNKL